MKSFRCGCGRRIIYEEMELNDNQDAELICDNCGEFHYICAGAI